MKRPTAGDLPTSAVASPNKEAGRDNDDDSVAAKRLQLDRHPIAYSKHNPRSRDDLLSRIASFTVARWATQPIEFDPVLCALFGWQCSTQDDNDDVDGPRTLRCETCGEALIVDNDSTDVDGVRRILTESHQLRCPWRANPSSDRLYSLPATIAVLPRKLIAAFVEQWWSLYTALSSQAQLQFHATSSISADQLDLLAGSLRTICEREYPDRTAALTFPVNGSNARGAALLLAVFGWQPIADFATKSVLRCEMCSRRVALWIFDSAADSQLNVEFEHRDWCYYVKDRHGTGWEMTVEAILRYADSLIA
ncbi:hypothetical protein GQ42DRAFT_35217 [Ramicandelaber brevisporus]|nr:hypothetical protein GQ42DRAFT_35217 [Ramicandelaber brevisporus]